MKVTERLFQFPPSPPRTGLHLSTIVRAIERDILGAELRPEARTPDEERRLMAMFEMGLLWERAFQHAARDRFGDGRGHEQLEVESDGVKMTLDWFDEKAGKVVEFKRTRVSTNTIATEGIEKKWPGYMIQVKSYCRAVKVRRADLIVDFVNGDYGWMRKDKTGGEEVVKVFELEFTKQEIEENWLLVLNKKKELLQPVAKKTFDPFARLRGAGPERGRGADTSTEGGVTHKQLVENRDEIVRVPWSPFRQEESEDDE